MEEVFKTLLRIPSISGSEQKVQGYIYNQLSAQQLKPKWIDGNVVLKVYGKDSTKAMMLNAHVDTVAPGDLSLWQSPPFGEGSGVIKNGQIYGLGASDEKSAVVVLLELAKIFKQKPPECDVWLTFVIAEETTGQGTKSVLNWFKKVHMNSYQKVSAVLLEPTGLETFEIGHRGNVFIKLTTKGDGGHGSKPDLVKTHAVFAMFEVLNQIKAIEQKWQKQYQDKLLGTPTIAIATSIQAGDITSPNKIGDLCTATLDIRTTPKLHPIVLNELKKELKKFNVQIEHLYDPAPLGITDQNDNLVKAINLILPKTEMTISQGATDQCFFTELEIPAIVFGPGEKSQMHRPNEYCNLAKVTKSLAIYQQLIKTWSNIL